MSTTNEPNPAAAPVSSDEANRKAFYNLSLQLQRHHAIAAEIRCLLYNGGAGPNEARLKKCDEKLCEIAGLPLYGSPKEVMKTNPPPCEPYIPKGTPTPAPAPPSDPAAQANPAIPNRADKTSIRYMNVAELQDEIARRKAENKMLDEKLFYAMQDAAHDDGVIREICAKYGVDVVGDSYGVPGIIDCVQKLAESLDAEAGRSGAGGAEDMNPTPLFGILICLGEDWRHQPYAYVACTAKEIRNCKHPPFGQRVAIVPADIVEDWTVRASEYDRLVNAARALRSACKDRLPPGYYEKIDEECAALDEIIAIERKP